MMILLYRLIYSILKFVILLVEPILPEKLQQWIKLRSQLTSVKLNEIKNVYWFHASSGEIEYVKSIIKELKKQNSENKILVTYSSTSAEKLFDNIKNDVDQFLAIPWDQPSFIKKIISHFQPKILIFSRTDLWFEMIYQAQSHQIKLAVVSYFPNLKTFNSFYLKYLLSFFDLISCVNDDVKNNLISLMTKSHSGLNQKQLISADGDTRYDQVFSRLAGPSKVTIVQTPQIFTCGSTWPEDENQLIPLFAIIKEAGYKIVLSPHEVQKENINRLVEILKKKNLSCQILSNENNFHQIEIHTDVLLIDKIGVLADLYRFSTIAFVGGSFKEKVHSVMEPICCGLPVLLGPFYKNNPEASFWINSAAPQFIFVAQNLSELLKNFNALQKENLTELKKEILNALQENKKSTQKIMSHLANMIPEN